MFTITNIDEIEILSTNSEKEFIHFTNNIAKENEDFDFDLRSKQLCIDYINEYCDNLLLTFK